MGRKKILKEKQLIEAIHGSRGFKSVIAQRLHCNWHTVDDAIKASPAAQLAMQEEDATTLDFVEGKAITKINEGDGAMIRFYLATKGKKRGYTYDDRIETDISAEDNEINVICDTEEAEPKEPQAEI